MSEDCVSPLVDPTFAGVAGTVSTNPKKLSAIRSSWLSRISHQGGIAGANLAVWRSDMVAINGFNEQFVGHGGEDADLAMRLKMAGVLQRKLRHLAMAYHFAHTNHPHGSATRIREVLEETQRDKKIRCEQGLDRAMREKECAANGSK